MTHQATAAVLGVGGQQNQRIAAHLAGAGLHVRGLGRAGDRPAALAPSIDYRTVDPTQVDALAKALDGADVAVMTSPIDHRPGARERFVETVLTAAGRASVGRIVFNAAATVLDDRTNPLAKVLGSLADAVLAGPVPAVVLQPTVFMDNLQADWALAPIVNDGVMAYAMPEEAPVSWISHDSLGAFVHAAATRDVVGRSFRIGGPEPLTGPEVARTLTAVLGRHVAYVRIPPSALAEGLNMVFGAPAGDDIGSLYEAMSSPDVMRRDPADWAELGVVPETLETWARRQNWSIRP
jgi:NAD(P)H dehydrogenase (quinone)